MQPSDGQGQRHTSLAGFIHRVVNSLEPPSPQDEESAETASDASHTSQPADGGRPAAPASPFHPIEPSRASGQVVEQVCDLVASGKLRPGERLPPEREMVQILQVGRSTLREALRLLESLGLVETRPGEGTFVTTDEVPLTILPRPVASGTGQQYILETRRLLEPQIAALAAERATAADLEMLRTILRLQAEQVVAARPGKLADLGFHAGLCQVTRNPILERLHASFQDVLRESRRAHNVAGWPARSLRDHEGIFAAIEARDARLARHRMTKHLEGVQRVLQKLGPSPPDQGGSFPT